MALFDMIQKTMTPKVDSLTEAMNFMHSSIKNTQAMETARQNTLRKIAKEKQSRECVAMTPEQFLAAVECNMQIKGTRHPNLITRPMTAMEALHYALEETLPDEHAPVPTDDETSVMDGHDDTESMLGVQTSIEDVDPDQPNPEDDFNNDTTLTDIMNTPQDTEVMTDDALLAEEGFSDFIGRVSSGFVKRDTHQYKGDENLSVFKTAKEFAAAIKSGECVAGNSSFSGMIGGIRITIQDNHDPDIAAQNIDICMVNLARVVNDVAEELSTGPHKPWMWEDEPDRVHTSSDVKKKIKITGIDLYSTSHDGYAAVFWFADGGLYDGHTILTVYAVENRKLKLLDKPTIEG